MESNKNGNVSGETDLGQFFSGIGKTFSAFFLSIVVGLAGLRRVTVENKYLFIALVVIGVAFGIFYDKNLDKKFYESTMILNSDYMNKRTVDNSISNLNLLANEESKAGLMRTLNINDSLARNIVQFEARPFIEEDDVVELKVLKEQLKNSKLELENPKVIDDVIERLEIENRHAFEIIVRLYNPNQFKGLEHALVNFFRNTPYISKRIEINNINLIAKKNKLESEIRKLDSLKKALYSNYQSMAEQNRQGSNNVILNDKLMERPIDLFTRTIDLYEDLEELNKLLFLHSDFEVVDGFAELNVPASASTSKIIVISVLVSIGIGYILVGLVKLDRHLNRLA